MNHPDRSSFQVLLPMKILVLEPRPMIVRFWKNNGEDEEEKVRK
jgi:hypothetical protein